MKIIKKGREQKGWSAEFECTGNGNGNGGCGSILLVEQKDIYQTNRHSYGDTFPDYFLTFKCCNCGVLTDIPDRFCPLKAKDLPHISVLTKGENNSGK